MELSRPMPMEGKTLYLVNPSGGDVAATLKTSNHRAGNILDPKGGRAEMGVMEIMEDSVEYLAAASRGRMENGEWVQHLEIGEEISNALCAGFGNKVTMVVERRK